jgi:adenosylhomocysteinase
VIVILHFLLDLLPFMRALELRGLDPHKTLALYKDYPYSNRDLVRSTLESRGVTVWGPVGSTNGLELAAGVRDFLAEGDEPVIIVEDGGYLAPAFYNTEELRPYLHRIRGVVEQTTFGARQAEDLLVEMQRKGEEARLAFPLINVARSEAKVLYEPAFVAEAACNNIVIKLGGLSWINTGVLLIGYGAIGRAMFSMLKRLQARVVVCDPSPLRLLLADSEQANFIAPSIPSAIAWFKEQKINLDFVIGTTGKQSVLVADAIAMAGWSPRLVSVSSKRIEFAIEDFGTQAQSDRPLMIQEHNIGTEYIFSSGSIKVLGDGYPINFVSSESVPNERIDPIMALLHVCAAELANPDVLLVGGAFLGEADSVYPGIPRTRISHEIVQTIIDKTDLFRPLLSNSHSEVKQI